MAAAQKLKSIIKPYFTAQSASFDSAFAAYNRGESAIGKNYELLNVAITKKINDSIAGFIEGHPYSFISLAELNELHKYYGSKQSKVLYQSLSNSLKNHSIGKQLKYEIYEAGQLNALNKRAISFQQKDTLNHLINISDYRANYLLIDFWASWCGPCRAENPNIKQAYFKYHSRGFDVLGVSLDNNRVAWKKAIIGR